MIQSLLRQISCLKLAKIEKRLKKIFNRFSVCLGNKFKLLSYF